MNSLVLNGSDPATFTRATAELARFRGPNTQNFGVAVAVLLHRNVPGAPRLGPPRLINPARTGAPIPSGALERQICDETWRKAPEFLPADAEGPVHKPFTSHYKALSSSTSNNWRHSFNVQAGIGCDAPTGDLQRPSFLEASRLTCPYRSAGGICASPAGRRVARCYDTSKGRGSATSGTNALDRPKLLARGTDGRGRRAHWFIEPTVPMLASLLPHPDRRVPVYPFAAVLYGGSPYLRQWGDEISCERLERDLVLSHEAFATLFDIDPSSPANAALLDLASQRPSSGLRGWRSALSEPSAYRERTLEQMRSRARRAVDPERAARLRERANAGHRQTLHALVQQLEAAGYELTEQPDGYDLCATRDAQLAHLFEVKTWTPVNLSSQIRSAAAQLLEYRYRNRARLPETVRLHLVFEREPPPEHWAWDFLADELRITPAWIAEGRLTAAPEHAGRLPS